MKASEVLRKYRVFPIFCTLVIGWFMWYLIRWVTATPLDQLDVGQTVAVLGVVGAVMAAGMQSLASVVRSVERDQV